MIKLYYRLHDVSRQNFPQVYGLIFTYRKFVKYFIAGCTAAGVDLLLLFVFTDIIGMWYLVSAILAFSLAIGVSFILQKYWAFRNTSGNTRSQMVMYLIAGLFSLLLNALLMFILVDIFGLHYMVAQIANGVVVAGVNFLIYHFIIFRTV